MKAAVALTILYEDQRGQRQGFGLHTLVKACVFDAINGERHRIEGALSDYRPLKGVDNVLKACREDFDLIAADGRTVVAVLDNDAIRHKLKLPPTAKDAQVEQAIRKGCQAPERLLIALIKENMESVIEAAATCDPGLDPKRVERAIKRKELLERDAILTEFSRERARPLRDCVLGKVPSLQSLVDLLLRILRGGAAVQETQPAEAGARKRKGAKLTR